MADSKVTLLPAGEISVPALEDLTYWVDDPSGTPVSNKASMTRAFGLLGLNPGGRLTLTTAVPITTSDVSAAGTVYYTPYLHDRIRIYDGTRWRVYSFTERSLALTATSGKNYDVFIYDNAGTLTLELSAAWTNNTTRSAALTTQDGVTVKSGATTRLWLGTIRGAAANQTEDSVTKRFVWNAYNQVQRRLFKANATDNWAYNSVTVRQANGDATQQVELVHGLLGTPLTLTVYAMGASSGANYFSVSIGEDSTTAYSSDAINYQGGGVASVLTPLAASMSKYPTLGYHYYAWLEAGNGSGVSTTFYSTNSGVRQGGLSGFIPG